MNVQIITTVYEKKYVVVGTNAATYTNARVSYAEVLAPRMILYFYNYTFATLE